MPKKSTSKAETTKEALTTEITGSEVKPPKEVRKFYYLAIAILIMIAFFAGWFALKTIFPKIVNAPTVSELNEEQPPPRTSQATADAFEGEKPIESFDDVDGALKDLDNRVGELDKIDSDLEAPNINLDSLGL